MQQEKGDTLDLSGWITMRNDSGSGFTNARIKLLAGDVSKRLHPESGYGPPEVPQTFGGNGPVVSEKALDEFHVYTLPQATTLNDRETKQVEFLRVSGVKSERTYVYDGVSLANWTVGQSGGDDPNFGLNSNQKVAVYRTFVNSEGNKLGIPLPKGTIRFYTQDAKDGSLQFVGENEVDHTAKDEKVRVYVGNSFDLTGERKRTNFKIVQANHRLDESFAITLRNHKTEPVEVSVVERLYRYLNWEVTAKSQDFARKNAQTIEFRVTLKPDEEKTITYTVDYRW